LKTGKDDGHKEDEHGEAMVGRLIATAGPGKTASAQARERIYEAVRASWLEAVESERPEAHASAAASPAKRIWMYGLAAAAATVAVTVLLLEQAPSPVDEHARLASVAAVAGTAELIHADAASPPEPITAASTIESGDRLRTSAGGRVALELADGLDLRINVGSEIVFAAADRVLLAAGTVYVDSGAIPGANSLRLETSLGSVTHVGTQYEVRFDGQSLRLRVREGAVVFSGSDGDATGQAGEQIDVGTDGRTARSAIAPDDDEWAWAAELSTLPAADSYVLGDVLEWIARESGLKLEYPSQETELRLANTKIVGLAGQNPQNALDIVGRTTSVRYEIRDGRLIVLE
jgi:ferric-dicitrate binding protein FerR (iron transport regulator)